MYFSNEFNNYHKCWHTRAQTALTTASVHVRNNQPVEVFSWAIGLDGWFINVTMGCERSYGKTSFMK